jgi:hypothetical protein
MLIKYRIQNLVLKHLKFVVFYGIEWHNALSYFIEIWSILIIKNAEKIL